MRPQSKERQEPQRRQSAEFIETQNYPNRNTRNISRWIRTNYSEGCAKNPRPKFLRPTSGNLYSLFAFIIRK